MENIKEKLKDIIQNQMIPESCDYLEELHQLLKENKATKEDIETIKDMESFLVELQNILEAIETNMLDEIQAEEIYNKIIDMIESHEH